MKNILLLFLTLSISYSQETNLAIGDIPSNTSITSFSSSKRKLLKEIYPSHQKSVYCGCDYNIIETMVKKTIKVKMQCEDPSKSDCFKEVETERKKTHVKPDLPSCGYEIKGSGLRANRIEWEHVVPAHHLAHHWDNIWTQGHEKCITSSGNKYKGRRCVEKVVQQYKYMQADMHNLYPAIGEVNGYRSDYQVAIIPGEAYEFGKCDVEIESRKFEPSPQTRGEVARTYFYMDQAYGEFFELDKTLKTMLVKWAKADPPSTWECERNQLISKIQGNENLVVTKACEALKSTKENTNKKDDLNDETSEHFETLKNSN
ncbi:MAG: endonuclease [Candidatus Cloacimonetes bacterium]|nr:endonuclease [Candidatus Cloacimonadota bacterium]